ncbi:MAG: DUF5615 family PIN-like protein [Chloroflexota bacterium]
MRFLADENFDNDILRGIRRKNPNFDVIRVQDTEVYQADDPTVLSWAAREGRILLTHDLKTMSRYAYDRIEAGLPMLGVIEIGNQVSVGQAIDELLLIDGASDAAEWENKVTYLPLH